MKLRLSLLMGSAVGIILAGSTFTSEAQASNLTYTDTAISSSQLSTPAVAGTPVTLGNSVATSDNVNNFSSLQTNVGNLFLENAQVVAGASGIHAVPYGLSNSTPYVSVYSNGAAVFTFTKPVSSVSFDWGSIDTYNSASAFSTNGNTLTITGTQLTSSNGNQGLGGSDLVTITAGLNDSIQSLILNSSGIAFEAGNFSVSSVPLPAALPLFGAAIAGLGGLGGLGLRRRKAAAV